MDKAFTNPLYFFKTILPNIFAGVPLNHPHDLNSEDKIKPSVCKRELAHVTATNRTPTAAKPRPTVQILPIDRPE